MDSFILEQQLCDYIEGMDVIPELWEPHSLDSPMAERIDYQEEDEKWHSHNINLILHNPDDDLNDDSSMVILRDRLITDAALCDSRDEKFKDNRLNLNLAPICTEHSYSVADSSVVIDVKAPVAASATVRKCFLEDGAKLIKLELPSSPSPASESSSRAGNGDEFLNLCPETKTSATPAPQTKFAPRETASRQQAATPSRIILPRLSIQLENNIFTLPPTPPSSTSSDSEGSLSPTRDVSSPRGATPTGGRILIPKTSLGHASSSRQPINSPLISYQPKGSIGVLNLTEEEKRTLLAEGYSVPTKLPLTKAEEKSLKKIRRKIKNKISAQESRRKKKEYMDTLERQASLLVDENAEYRLRVSRLEADNTTLLKELKRLQQLVAKAGLQTQAERMPITEVVVKCENQPAA